MTRTVTHEHVSIEHRDEDSVLLRPTARLLEALGASPRFTLHPAGTCIGKGRAYGVVLGANEGCHLFAPADLEIVHFDAANGEVEVRLRGPLEHVMSEAEYERRFAQSASVG